ncbi:MAG: hypothetical protein PVG41_14575, partial [Desulfobacteraceae bacterium]
MFKHNTANQGSLTPVRRQVFGLVVGIWAAIFAGCGYHFAGRGQLPGGVDRIAVNVLINRSTVNDIES